MYIEQCSNYIGKKKRITFKIQTVLQHVQQDISRYLDSEPQTTLDLNKAATSGYLQELAIPNLVNYVRQWTVFPKNITAKSKMRHMMTGKKQLYV